MRFHHRPHRVPEPHRFTSVRGNSGAFFRDRIIAQAAVAKPRASQIAASNAASRSSATAHFVKEIFQRNLSANVELLIAPLLRDFQNATLVNKAKNV